MFGPQENSVAILGGVGYDELSVPGEIVRFND
jgi:hypothetical protein